MRLRAFIITFIGVFLGFTFILGFIPLPLSILISFFIALIVSVFTTDTLNSIKSTEVGDEQHGSSRFASSEEIKSYYDIVSDKQAKKPGFVVGRDGDKWIVDTSDTSTTLLAPPGAGKTTCVLIPTLLYNGIVNKNTNGNGASFIITDLKGEELEVTGEYMKECGYKTPVLDFSNPLASNHYNILENINKYIDTYKEQTSTDNEKTIAYAKAERYAKILAESIVDNVDGISKNEAGQFFTETAKGLVCGISLLVSEYANRGERHIISVFKLIVELNGLDESSTNDNQKSKLATLLENIDNSRIVNYVGPAMSADVKISMNIFSSALSKLVAFIDAEFEQMLCSHSDEFNDIDFIKKPTAIYIICPDENTSRHFFASLFIRFLMNDLMEQARFTDNKLSREVLCLWDEFGNMPAIKNLDVLLTAARSRRIRFILALQSIGQLEKSYPGKMSKIVFDAAQCIMFTKVSPTAKETAETLSKMLGNQTIKSGSISVGKNYSTSYQMMGRELLKPDEIMRIKQNNFILLRGGQYPAKTISPFYFHYTKKELKPFKSKLTQSMTEIKYCTANDFMNLKNAIEFTIGMFD